MLSASHRLTVSTRYRARSFWQHADRKLIDPDACAVSGTRMLVSVRTKQKGQRRLADFYRHVGREMEDEGLIQLIGEIYDAGLESRHWPAALAKIAKFVGGQAPGLFSQDAERHLGNVYFQAGIDPCYVQLYSQTYWKFDPVARLSDREVGQIVSVPDLLPYDEFCAGRFYREWAEPQGWVDAANAVLEKTMTSWAYLS